MFYVTCKSSTSAGLKVPCVATPRAGINMRCRHNALTRACTVVSGSVRRKLPLVDSRTCSVPLCRFGRGTTCTFTTRFGLFCGGFSGTVHCTARTVNRSPSSILEGVKKCTRFPDSVRCALTCVDDSRPTGLVLRRAVS